MNNLCKLLPRTVLNHIPIRFIIPIHMALTFTYIPVLSFVVTPLHPHPSGTPTRIKWMLRNLLTCTMWPFLFGIDCILIEYNTVDDNNDEEFDKNKGRTRAPWLKVSPYNLHFVEDLFHHMVPVMGSEWWCLRWGRSVLKGRLLWRFDMRVQNNLPWGTCCSSRTKLLNLRCLLFVC